MLLKGIAVDSLTVQQEVAFSTGLEISKFFETIDTSYAVTEAKLLTPAKQAWVTIEYVIGTDEEELFSLRVSFNSRPSQYSTFLQEYAGVTIVSKKDLEHFSFSKHFSFNSLDNNGFRGYVDIFKDASLVSAYIKRLKAKIKSGIKQAYSQYLKSIKSSKVLSYLLKEMAIAKWDKAVEPIAVINDSKNSYVQLNIGGAIFNTSLYEAQNQCYLLTISNEHNPKNYIVYKFIRYTPVISIFWNFKLALKIGVKLLKNKFYYKKSPFVREINDELEEFISDALAL